MNSPQATQYWQDKLSPPLRAISNVGNKNTNILNNKDYFYRPAFLDDFVYIKPVSN
jgi:hypothetical protein